MPNTFNIEYNPFKGSDLLDGNRPDESFREHTVSSLEHSCVRLPCVFRRRTLTKQQLPQSQSIATPSSVAAHEDLDADEMDEESDIETGIPNVRTFVRAEAPQKAGKTVSRDSCRGLQADITLQTPTCCGGGIVRGVISLSFNAKAKKNKNTQISSIQLDCIGIEAVKGHEAKMFFTIAQDILTSGIYLADLNKTFLQADHVKAGQCFVPFELQLPLDIGPGTFVSKEAEIEYTLTATICQVNGKRFPQGRVLRLSKRLKLFPCLDPQRVLVPTSAPIDVLEEGKLRFGGKSTVKVAARMHRPTWIAGQTAYVDVSVTNDSSRAIWKIQLELVRHISYFKSAAASSAFRTVDQRVPERIATKSIATSIIATGSSKSDISEWAGVRPGARETVGCRVEVPLDELSVSAGRYFETKYVIQIFVVSKGGSVELELPITLIHMNSLDVIPSSIQAVSRMIATYASPIKDNEPTKINSIASRRPSLPSALGTPDQRQRALRSGRTCSTPLIGIDQAQHVVTPASLIDQSGAPQMTISESKPGIQCDLRRALSLDYQSRFCKLDIAAERASWTQGAPLAKRSPERKKKDLTENLAYRLHRERSKNPNFYDVL